MPRGSENVMEPPQSDDPEAWEKFLAQDVGPAELGEDPGKKALKEQAGISVEENPAMEKVRHAIERYYVFNETRQEGAHLQKAQEVAKDSGLGTDPQTMREIEEMMREIEDEVTDVRQEALIIAEKVVRNTPVLAFRTLALSTKILAALQEQYPDFDEQALEGIAEETAMRFTAGSSKY